MSAAFQYKELVVKQKLLQLAKECVAKPDVANQLAGALLYANIADYLAMSLYESLVDSANEAVRRYFLGDISLRLKPRKKNPTLGDLIVEIDEFDFPSKPEILEALKKINAARIPVIHHIAKTPSTQLHKIDQAIPVLAASTEDLVNLMDELYNKIMPPKTIISITAGQSQTQPSQ